jgi:hypothetical protein
MKKILPLVDVLEGKISNYQKVNTAISATSVGWHLQHTLLVLINVTEGIKKSNPQEFKPNFNFARTIVFTLNKIPRGKGKAPKSVQPATEITLESLTNNILLAKQKLLELYSLDKNKHFAHPFFGSVKLSGCIKFLHIHTLHHLKIIEDILK